MKKSVTTAAALWASPLGAALRDGRAAAPRADRWCFMRPALTDPEQHRSSEEVLLLRGGAAPQRRCCSGDSTRLHSSTPLAPHE
ncbi:hypothetical protein EYF80_064834 [Liparis tanakae]|uniref:Uncharacterized protein n=1 Tax=Liparis tanakae TaxID=230148 RepID=A0A4Z2E8Z3_9TELE|nr:hypothetical protein EYF80_064834 [Liparis tanakae]